MPTRADIQLLAQPNQLPCVSSPSSPLSSFAVQCITNWHRENGYNHSLQLPDATLNFAKKHPLMAEEAQARPLLLTKGVNFTRLAVDRVSDGV